MTTLLVHSEHTPLAVHFPSLAQMTTEQFYEFCRTNSELRIERTAAGEVVIMLPTFSDTGNRNFNLVVQLGVWAEQDATGIGFDSNTGFTLPNGATRSPDASWIRLDRTLRTVHVYRLNPLPQIIKSPDSVSGEPELPGFVLQMAKIG